MDFVKNDSNQLFLEDSTYSLTVNVKKKLAKKGEKIHHFVVKKLLFFLVSFPVPSICSSFPLLESDDNDDFLNL